MSIASTIAPRVIESIAPLLRIEAAVAGFACEYGAALGITSPSREPAVLEIDGAVALFAGEDSPLSKCVGIGGAFGEEAIDAVERFYRDRNVAPSFELSPLSSADLRDRLVAREYEQEYNLMVMTRPPAAPIDAQGESRITILSGAEVDRALWASTIAAGFSGLSPALLLEIFTTNAAIPSVTRWLALVDDTPAGGGTMSIDHGVAHLFGTSVLPEFRRHGVQRELVRARLEYATGEGCDLATVTASPGSDSERNLRRFGFGEGWLRRVLKWRG